MSKRRWLRRFPGFAARVEAESREWMIECPRCGHRVSVWEAGGVRYKACGKARRLARCPNCRQLAMMRLYRENAPGAPSDESQ